MEKSKIKSLLEALHKEATDASTKEKIQELLIELETITDNKPLSDSTKVPKSFYKKVFDFIAQFFLKMVQHKLIREIWKRLEELDKDP